MAKKIYPNYTPKYNMVAAKTVINISPCTMYILRIKSSQSFHDTQGVKLQLIAPYFMGYSYTRQCVGCKRMFEIEDGGCQTVMQITTKQ